MDINSKYFIIFGWRKIKADREAHGKPFYGELEEELEKEKYGIED